MSKPKPVINGQIECCSCREWKILSEFAISKYTLSGRTSICKNCYNLKKKEYYNKDDSKLRVRKWRLKNYNLSEIEFNNLLIHQDYKCAICDSKFSDFSKINIDHSHSSGKVRGLLCRQCNLGLGHFTDSKDMLKQAITYLEASEL